ncbi:MAG TPA: DUF3014 domain-containing protein [Gammaproteobacteria bacterium]|nr:DUF3014 domain-containing protein [Gammaproteobacteria bacterium]
MNRYLPWLLAIAVFGAGAVAILYEVGGNRPAAPAAGTGPQGAPAQSPQPATPRPQQPHHYPLTRPGQGQASGKGTARQGTGGGHAKSSPLPPLAHSDAPLRNAFTSVLGKKPVERFLVPKRIVRHVVVTVDNLTRRQVPPRDNPVKPVPGRFEVTRRDGDLYIDRSNYSRYTPYVKLLDTLNVDALVDLYVRFYPLFQEQYRKLGYPHAYFNDRVVEAIDNLLAAPVVKGPVKLVQPRVMYKYADPDLEHLAAGQKILVRMGPKNEAQVKARLRALRKALLSHVADHSPKQQSP